MTEAAHVAALREAAERKQFEAFMERNVARLQTFAQPYIGRLVPSQRHEFLKLALELAWTHRAELKAKKTAFAEEHIDILHWWERYCLQPTARSKPCWTLRKWNGELETVKGTQLGRAE
jgi:hypothetical protein